MFENRIVAGQRLADELSGFEGNECVVLGIPRGGVIVARKVADKLGAQLDVVIPLKVGAPYNSEIAVGAVTEDGNVFWDERLMKILGVMPDLLEDSVKDAEKEIKRRTSVYRDGKEKVNLNGKNVILVDDGIATGFTILAAVKSIKDQKPKSITLAVPVASKEALNKFEGEVDKIICLDIPEDFRTVGQFYEEFGQVSDDEVIELLKA
jgi:predicted phosphoribosyltransferase